MLEPTGCIRLATSFDTFQQCPTRPVWVDEKILEILTKRDIGYNSKFKKLGPIL